MKWFTVFSHRSFYYRSIAALIVGIVALFVPRDTLQTLVRLIGLFVLFAGVGTALAMRKEGHSLLHSFTGTAAFVSIFIGLFLVVRPGLFVKVIVTVLGVVLVFVGLMQLLNVVRIRKSIQNVTFYLIAGLIPFVMGLVFIVFQKQIQDVIGIILGVTLIVYALNELGLGFRMRRYFKAKGEDAPYEEIEVEEVEEEVDDKE